MVALSGLIDGIAFAFTPKSDTRAVTFLAFIDGTIGILPMVITGKKSNPHDPRDGLIGVQQYLAPPQKSHAMMDSAPHTVTEAERLADVQPSNRQNSAKEHSRLRKSFHVFLRVGNRCLIVLHCLFSVISTAGAIELALLYRYTNP